MLILIPLIILSIVGYAVATVDEMRDTDVDEHIALLAFRFGPIALLALMGILR